MLPVPSQNYSIQPASEIRRCGAQGDNRVWAASRSTLHEQWGKKVGGWWENSGTAACLFLTAYLRISQFVPLISAVRFHFLERFFLIPMARISGFFLLLHRKLESYFHSSCSFSASSSPTLGRIRSASGAWLTLSPLHFVSSLSIQHNLTKKQRVQQGLGGGENQ